MFHSHSWYMATPLKTGRCVATLCNHLRPIIPANVSRELSTYLSYLSGWINRRETRTILERLHCWADVYRRVEKRHIPCSYDVCPLASCRWRSFLLKLILRTLPLKRLLFRATYSSCRCEIIVLSNVISRVRFLEIIEIETFLSVRSES